MEFHGRPRKVILDYDGNNERALTRMTLYRLGVPARVIEEHMGAAPRPSAKVPESRESPHDPSSSL